MMVPGGSAKTVLEIGTFKTHTKSIAGRPNGHVGGHNAYLKALVWF